VILNLGIGKMRSFAIQMIFCLEFVYLVFGICLYFIIWVLEFQFYMDKE